MRESLDRLRPSAIAICGYATPDARECLRWARRNGARAILMTETRECDAPRVWWKEWIKSRLVRRFHGGLCGGPAARAYLGKLGMPADRIEEGYDVVDDAYFSAQAEKYRCFGASEAGFPAREIPRYFLASNRFIERKNVAGLIEAYAAYVKSYQLSVISDQDEDTESARPWHLCLLGDGELKPDLIAKSHALGLQVIESAPWEVASSTSTIINHQSTIINQGSASSLTPDS